MALALATSPVYRPRMHATLTVPVAGTRAERINQAKSTEAITLQVHPRRIHLESNDHNHADSLELTADWTEVGVDPRMLENAVIQLFVDNADDFGHWEQTRDNCRFVGLTKDTSATRNVSSAAEVTFACVDYTTLFLKAKPFGSSGVPTFDQRLDEAWRRIVSQTPGAEVLADRLVLEGLVTFPELSSAVAERFKKIGKVPTHPDTDAWAVWQQCVGMLGLISYIRLDEVVVTTATNYYTEKDSPLLVWGNNLEEWEEVRHSELVGKGIGVTSFDPLSGTTIESYFPPIGDQRLKRKPAAAKKVLSEEQIRQREERDWFPYPGVTQRDVLDKIAERIWEERGRQELEGHFKTPHMDVLTESGKVFELLDLKAGDTIRVEIDPEERQILAVLPTDGARKLYLNKRGYNDDVATLIIKNMKEFARLGAKFHVQSAITDFEINDEGGTFAIEAHYCNRIQIDGSATE